LALSIPVIGFNPIKGQIFTQVFNTFALPLVVFSFIVLWNRKGIGLPNNKTLINVILVAALIFSLIITPNGLLDVFSN